MNTPSEIANLQRARVIGDNPRYRYLLKCGERDLELGRHDRQYRISECGKGAILKATIDCTNMFYALGDVKAHDLEWIHSFSGKGELHFEPHQIAEVLAIKNERMSDFAEVRFYHLGLNGGFHFHESVQMLDASDFDEISALTKTFYPGSSFVKRMLETAFFGIRENGKIVATGGIIFLDEPAKACQIGSFFTHPDYRGRGYCNKIIQHLLANLAAVNVSDVRLEVYARNQAAWRAYEKFGFVVEKLGLESLIEVS